MAEHYLFNGKIVLAEYFNAEPIVALKGNSQIKARLRHSYSRIGGLAAV